MQCSHTFLGWYVPRDGRPTGPLATEEVERLVVAGRLRPTEEVLKAFQDRYGRVRFFGSQARAAIDNRQDGKALGDPIMLRILIVDDCSDGANTLATLLRMWGHDVEVAFTGPAALELADSFRPEVFLLDIGLPEMDGCHLARQLRGRASSRDALVIAISGYADPAHLALGKQAGFDLYLVKPVNPSSLQEFLGRWAAGEGSAEEIWSDYHQGAKAT